MSRNIIFILAILFESGISAQPAFQIRLGMQNKYITTPDSNLSILSTEKNSFSLYQSVIVRLSTDCKEGNPQFLSPSTFKSKYSFTSIPELHIGSGIIDPVIGPSPSGFRITQTLYRPFGKLTFNPAFTRSNYNYNFTGTPRLVNETFWTEILKSALH